MIAAVIVAAGQGLRMGASQRKQYMHLGDLPILAHTLRSFDQSRVPERIILVVPREEKSFCDREILKSVRLKTPVELISGGRQRQDSVFNGLRALDDQDAIVLIHDGVRPLVSTSLIKACVDGAIRWGACIPGLPVVDTLKLADQDGRIQRTVDRDQLYAVQTPQAFRLSVILAAHRAGRKAGGSHATDDASLVEAMGHPVHIIHGERENIKITTPEDLSIARSYLRAGSRK